MVFWKYLIIIFTCLCVFGFGLLYLFFDDRLDKEEQRRINLNTDLIRQTYESEMTVLYTQVIKLANHHNTHIVRNEDYYEEIDYSYYNDSLAYIHIDGIYVTDDHQQLVKSFGISEFIEDIIPQVYPQLFDASYDTGYGFLHIDDVLYMIAFHTNTHKSTIGAVKLVSEEYMQYLQDRIQLQFTQNPDYTQHIVYIPIQHHDINNVPFECYYIHDNSIYIEWRQILIRTLIILTLITEVLISLGIYYFGTRLELERNLRKTQEEYLEHEIQYQLFMEMTPDGIIISQAGKIQYANPTANMLYFRGDFGNLVGYNIYDIVHKNYHEELTQRVKLLLTSDEALQPKEYTFLLHDGTTFWGEATASRIQFKGQTAMLTVIRDITLRKKQEKALREQNNTIAKKHRIIRTLIDNSPDLIYAKDIHNRFIEANTAVAEWMGVKNPNDLIGKTDYDCYSPEEAQTYLHGENEVIRSGQPLVNDIQHMTNITGNTSRYYLTSKYPLFNAKGKVVGIVGTGRDITQIREEHQQLYNLDQSIQALPLGVTIVDLDGNIVYTNEEEAKMHGYHTKELYGKSARIFSPESQWHHFNAENVTQWHGFTRQSINVKKDGTQFPVELVSEIIHTEENEPAFIITISKDITHDQKLERELIRLNTAIETTHVGVTITDDQGCIVYSNDADIKMHGYDSPLELIGQRSHILAPEARRREDFRSEGSHKEYPSWQRETTNVRKDGSTFIAEIISNPIYDQFGRFQGRVSICTDITQRKEQEETMRVLLEKVPFGIAVVGQNRKIIHLNQVAADLVEISPEDAIGIDCHTTICTSGQQCPVLDGGQDIYKHECILISASGKKIPILKSILRIKLNGEDVLLETFLDIRERVAAEEKIKHQQQLLKTVIDTIPDYVYAKNLLHEMILANKAVVTAHGFENTDDIIGKTDFDFHSQEFAEQYYHDEEHVMLSGKGFLNKEEQVITVNNEEQWVLSSKVPLRDPEHNVIGIVGFNRDITQHKQRELDVMKQKQQYEHLYTLVRMMCDNVPDMIWAKDLAGNYLFTNKALCEKLLIAESTQEPIGKDTMFFVNRQRDVKPNNATWHTFGELCHNSDRVVLDNDIPQRFDEYGYIQGEFLFLDVFKAPFKNNAHKTIGTVGCGRIVTKERAAKLALERAHTVFKSLYDVGKHIFSATSLKETMNIIAHIIPELLHSDTGIILLLNESKEFLYIESAHGISHDTMMNTHTKIGENIAGRVVQNKTPLIVHDIQHNPIFMDEDTHTDLLSCISVPIIGSHGVIGTLDSHSKSDPYAFNEADISTLELLANYTSLAIENATLYEELKFSREQYKIAAEQLSVFLKGMRT